jgi:DNA repair exonuclease SbcCD nuclease subunit|tara:strand:+ start:1544 stop:2503 length:960 start_codon:yes stop_codon:yes gene_type:complete
VILFTADWHIKLGQKNVPMAWACSRYKLFFEAIHKLESNEDITMHIIGGDLFDRVPSMDELTLYFDFVKDVTIPTIIYDGNHEATKKNKTFFSNLKRATTDVNPLVEIIDAWAEFPWGTILPYADLHKKGMIELCNTDKPLFTHVRGEIPPHVTPEVDLERFKDFPVVYAGDLHSHSNTQRNIIYPGSPMTTSFHREVVKTGYILIEPSFTEVWTWHEFDLPQLLRKTVSSEVEMIATDFHHTIYEIEGDVADLANIKNSELLDKKVVKRSSEATLNLKDLSMEEELVEYLSAILNLNDDKIKSIMGVFNDYSKNATLG